MVKRAKLLVTLAVAIFAMSGCMWGLSSPGGGDHAKNIQDQIETFLAADPAMDSSKYESVLAPEIAVYGDVAGINPDQEVLERDLFIQSVVESVWPLVTSVHHELVNQTITVDGDKAFVTGDYIRRVETTDGTVLIMRGTIGFELTQVGGIWFITGISLHTDEVTEEPGDGGDPGTPGDPEEPEEPEEPEDPVEPEEPVEPEDPTPDLTIEVGLIRKGSANFETPYYVLTSSTPGPTLMVVGGVHGNETAGYMAAERIVKEWAPDKGRVVVIPRANAHAIRLNRRGAPDLTDLNRRFPTGRAPIGMTANDIWDIVLKYRPDWFLDLHEGYDFHIVNKNSVGQSVIVYPVKGSATVARNLVNYLNGMPAVTNGRTKKFSFLQYPVSGSLARKVGADLGIPAAIIETAWPDPLERRIGFQVYAVRYIARQIGMELIPQEGLVVERVELP